MSAQGESSTGIDEPPWQYGSVVLRSWCSTSTGWQCCGSTAKAAEHNVRGSSSSVQRRQQPGYWTSLPGRSTAGDEQLFWRADSSTALAQNASAAGWKLYNRRSSHRQLEWACAAAGHRGPKLLGSSVNFLKLSIC